MNEVRYFLYGGLWVLFWIGLAFLFVTLVRS
jgi:hypothetical protein